MSQFDIWTELALPSDSDAKAVRRGYAARLRAIDADSDPAAFQRLRMAYEHALNHIAWRTQREAAARAKAQAAQPASAETASEPAPADDAPQSETPQDAPDRQIVPLPPRPQPAPQPQLQSVPLPPRERFAEPVPQPQATPMPPPARPPAPPARSLDDIERDAAIDALNARLAAKDSVGALAALTSALARGLLPLGERERALEAIMPMVIADKTLSASAYLGMLREVGWDGVPGVREQYTPSRKAAAARAEAENWFIELQRTAAGEARSGMAAIRSAGTEDARRQRMRAAQLMLRGGNSIFLSAGAAGALTGMLQGYHAQESWIAQRFDPATIATLESHLKWRGYLAKGGKGLRFAGLAVIGLLVAAIAIGAGAASGGIGFLIIGAGVYRALNRKA